MKIGFINYLLSRKAGDVETGSSIYARSFIKSLLKQKEIEEVKVITVGWEDYPVLDNIDGAKVYRLPCSLLPKLGIDRYEFLIKSLGFHKLIKDVDIIHAQHCFEGILANICKKKYGIPFILVREVVSKHLPTGFSRIFYFNVEKFLTKHLNYDFLVSWSKYIVDNYFLKWGVPERKIRVISGGIDTKIFNHFRKFKNIRKDYEITEYEFLFLSVKVMSLSNTLGLINSIKAFYNFLKDNPNAKYLIVGEGKGKVYLERLVKNLGISKNVILVGAIPSSELINYYRSSDATLHFFSYDASISISMLESLACGIPIIATNVGEVSNVINENVGILTKPNIRDFSNGMVTLCEDSNLREKMSKNAYNFAKVRFDIESIAKQYIKLYDELTKPTKLIT